MSEAVELAAVNLDIEAIAEIPDPRRWDVEFVRQGQSFFAADSQFSVYLLRVFM
ncbi:MAG: hypothetical protein GY906_22035 [bacterium]|nr:hypothetical protein [bacterium]